MLHESDRKNKKRETGGSMWTNLDVTLLGMRLKPATHWDTLTHFILCATTNLLFPLLSLLFIPLTRMVGKVLLMTFMPVKQFWIEWNWIKLRDGKQLTDKEKEWNCCWTLVLIEQCKCNLPVQQAMTLSYKAKLIWWPHNKTPELHRVGGLLGCDKGRTSRRLRER